MGVPKWEVLPKQGRQNSKLFNNTHYANEIFRVDNYVDEIIFIKIWGYQNKEISLK